jgi:hypothetical protein
VGPSVISVPRRIADWVNDCLELVETPLQLKGSQKNAFREFGYLDNT